MKPVIVRSVALGSGPPKLCAPLVGADGQAVLAEASALRGLPVDMAEWRFDKARAALCPAGQTPDAAGARPLVGLLRALGPALGELPLLFTYRTAAELSGRAGPGPADYASILGAACRSQWVDLVDIELNRGAALARSLAAQARALGALPLVSLHDFEKTPSVEAMTAALLAMEDAGAALAKLAVTPQNPQDVLNLFAAMEKARSRLQIPFTAMGMGRLGMLTRLGGGLFGAAFTFGAAGEQSAPGQPPAGALRAALTMLYGD